MKDIIPFYRQKIDTKHKNYIDEVLSLECESKVEQLEKDFSNFIGAKYALAVTNSTASLHLAMCALDLKRGDKIICNVNSFPDLPEVVRHFDAEPIFVDCVDSDYFIDLNKLEKTLIKNKSKKLRAVIINHIAGKVCDLDRLYEMAKKYKIKVIEDASDAMGSKYKGNLIGNTGADMVSYSFAPHLQKGIVDGGILVTDDEQLYRRAKLFRNHGIRSEEDGISFDSVDYLYNVVNIGWQYSMSEINATVCLAEFENLNDSLTRKKEISDMYLKELNNVKSITLPKIQEENTLSYFIIEVDTNRDAFARELRKEGVMIGLNYIPLHFMDYYKDKYSIRVFDFPRALGVYQRVMSLPMYHSLTDDEVMKVCNAIKKVAEKHI
ncbi:UDP-4-amino-4-deoxy-L-arabinose--oxoglutarate aminotransferase [hydrothermal vent metagenome]|uniref:UDP-4-amino-4-deoxy-L-arabinose--oxoglutarate aminotransferase n=1 Tax=hydrothermal vent metagenome TaxID=652676 RepID=A0A1W1BPN5_9ZZZZ